MLSIWDKYLFTEEITSSNVVRGDEAAVSSKLNWYLLRVTELVNIDSTIYSKEVILYSTFVGFM